MLKRISLFGLPLDVGVTGAIVAARIRSGKLLMTYLNPLAYRIPDDFPDYPEHLHQFDLVICDSVGVQKAVQLVYRTTTTVISPDYSGIGREIFAAGAQSGYSLCLVGGRPGITDEAARRISDEYPGYGSITSFDGYGASLDHARDHILGQAPQMIMIALGMGRQEAYLLDLVKHGWHGVGICVGGVLDKVARPELFYPEWSRRINMRFLGRWSQEPGRMTKRYLLDYRRFIASYLKHLIGVR
jgi:exopolysaccharide biosynthesis WecB/TagA/CpsF family protein